MCQVSENDRENDCRKQRLDNGPCGAENRLLVQGRKVALDKQENQVPVLEGLLDMQVKQGKLNALSALPGVLSMTSIGVAVFINEAMIIMIALAAVFALAFAIIRYINAGKIPLKSREIEDSFREQYVCPNPTCKHFLGFTPYNEVVKNRSCPYCRSKYTE